MKQCEKYAKRASVHDSDYDLSAEVTVNPGQAYALDLHMTTCNSHIYQMIMDWMKYIDDREFYCGAEEDGCLQ